MGGIIDLNTLLAGITIANAIVGTASSSDSYFGKNEINSTFTTPVTDSGLNSSGVLKTLTLSGGFTNVSGYAPASYFKTRENTVMLKGYVEAATIPNNTLIATLPAGFRPLTLERFHAYATVGGVVSSGVVEVNTSGEIRYFGSAATQVSISGLSFSTITHVIGNL